MKAPIGGRRLASFGRRLWEQGGLLQLRPAAGEREQLVGGGRAPFRWHCLGDLRFLRWRSHEAGGRLGGHGLGFGLGLVHRLARGGGGPATPVQLVLWLPGPSRVPALATLDDTVGPVAAVVGDALRLALDEIAAARDVNQRARNQHYDESPDCGRSAQPHAVQTRRGARPNWGGYRPPSPAQTSTRRLLGVRRERPRYRRTAEQRDERAPSHSITSSARASRAGGTVRPSALAVLRLIMSSSLVGNSTGKSLGLAPFSISTT